MSKLYDRRFKVGVALAVTVFVVLNLASYVAVSRRAAELERRSAELELVRIQLSGLQSLVWGWPFPWVDWVAAVNLAVLLFGALFFGLVFRWVTGFFK
jgi:hypothetical protein